MYEGYLERRLERQCAELLNAVLLLLRCYYLSHAQKHPHPQTADGELCEAAPAASHPDPPSFRGATSATQRAPSPHCTATPAFARSQGCSAFHY